MSDKTDDRTEDALGDGNALSLVYIKLHREVVEEFISNDVTKTAMKVYLYLSFNAVVSHGVSHRIPYSDIASYLKLKVRAIYKAVSDLSEIGLIRIRHHGDLVADMPYVLMANDEARKRGKAARKKKDDAKFKAEVSKHQHVLNRTLTHNEKERLRAFLSKQSPRTQ